MNRNSGRKSPGGDNGRGSDRNKKPFSKPSRGGERGGKPESKFGAKGKSFGSDKPSGEKNTGSARGKSFGSEKPFGDRKPSGNRSKGGFDKPSTDRKSGAKRSSDKPFGDKKFAGKPTRSSFSKSSSEKPKFGAEKPAARGKSTYKDFEAKGKRRSKFDDLEFDNEPRKAFGRDNDFGFDDEKPKAKKPGKNERPRVDGGRPKSKSAPSVKKETSFNDGGLAQAGIRLNKFIANSGMCSRREADVMIQNGVVTVNGKVMDELGYRVKPTDEVKFDGRTIIPEKPVYLLLNKPKDYITTAEDPQGRKTVMALIQGACKERVFPVGRLDRNTTGLLLFTNDGEMADKLTHPRKHVKKIYMVELDKNIKSDHLKELREGITLEDGPMKPDAVEYAEGPKLDKKVLGVEIHSGRNRIVRRMFEHFGYKVVKLDRVYLAGLTKKNLPRGHYRMLEPMEVNMLKML